MESSTRVLESQLDWLTLAVHSQAKNLELEHVADGLAREREGGQNELTPWRLNGYVGWRCGRVRYGTRAAAGLVQFSGDLAQEFFGQLYPLADSLTRLDLAVTARTPRPHDGLGQEHYWAACDFHARHPRSALPWCVQDADGGYTTYIGDRASDFCLRIYNKEAECHHAKDKEGERDYENCWRYELEVKGRAAGIVGEALFKIAVRRPWIGGMVHEWCCAHGVIPPWPAAVQPERLVGFRRRSDRDSRLEWLSRSVAPAVRWLLETGDRGEILRHLGLEDVYGDPDELVGDESE